MKRTSFPQRCLAILLCAATMLSLSIINGGTTAFALPSTPGSTCNSRFGRTIVGSDGRAFYAPASYTVLRYDSNGNTSFKTYTTAGNGHAHMYLYTQYNTDEVWSYCIESGVEFTASSGGYKSSNSKNSKYFTNLPPAAQKGIMLASVYGFQMGKSPPIAGLNNDDYFYATQTIMWEYQQQLRTSPTNIRDNGPISKDLYYNQLKGHPAEKAYDWILDKMEKHSKIPSFTSESSSYAPTHTLKYNAGSGKYSLTLTDTNGSGVDIKALSSSTSGISVTRNGNSYTFTTSNIINNPISIQYKKDLPVYGNALLVWGRPGYQTMCTGAEDPVQFYARFETESVGTLAIVKKADSDVSVAGWQFNIKGPGVDKNVTVDSNGRISVPNLIAGRYTISEINVPDYYQKPSSQTVDVLPGQTTEVQFYNKYLKGGLTIEKSSELDKMTAGVQFRITGVCDNGKTYNQVHTTDSGGRIALTNLYIGSYTITELGLPNTGIPSWIASPDSQTIRINSGSTSTTQFYNRLKRGHLEIQKQSEDGQFIAGIGFRVFGKADCGESYDRTFYTNAQGRVTVPNLLVGTYFVQEVAETVNGNYYVAATQVVAIKQDETTETQPYNKLKRVPLRIIKESYNGKNLEGIQFHVKGTTAAGSSWEHIYTTDTRGIVDVAEKDADAPPCGTYTISELESSVNIGYITPTDKQETFTYGDKVELYFYNAPKCGSIQIIKTDDLDNHFVEGRQFRLKGTSFSGDSIDLTAVTNAAGIAEFLEVPIGDYILSEEGVPIFMVQPDPEKITVVYAQTNEHDVENISKKTNLKIIKTSTDMQAIEGVPFRVVGVPLAGSDFAYDETFYTDARGEIFIPDLLIGNYSVTELESDITIGYIRPGPQNVTLEYGKSASISFFNKLIQNDVTVYKKDGFNNRPLAGVLFGLFDAQGKEVSRGRTNADGRLLFKDVRYGFGYTIRELEGILGYYPPSNDIHFDVVTDEQDQEFVVINERIPCDISVYKIDDTSKEPLAGVVFGLFDAAGKLVEKATTGLDGYAHFSPQVWGQTFTIRELEVPEGYLPSDKEETVVIKPGDTELTYEYVNRRVPCDITVLKTDGTSKEPLEGVKFGLFDKDGVMVQSGKTGPDGKVTFKGLVWGFSYQVRELEPLFGYLPVPPQDITIHKGDTLIELEAVNERIPCEIQIYKTDGHVKLPLEGAEFGLYREDGTLVETGVTDSNGYIRFAPQVWGQRFTIREISAPEGFLINEKIENLEIKPGDTEITIEFVNERQPCDISILKLDGYNKQSLPGVEFGLFDETGEMVQSGMTGEDGRLTFTGLIWGHSFQVKELALLTGYLPLADPIDVTIQRGDTLIELEATNDRRPVEIVVYKKDSSTKTPLAGAAFALYGADGNILQTGVSDEHGVVRFEGIIWGQKVYLKETAAPEGFVPSEEVIEIDLKPEDVTLEYTVENTPIRGSVHILKKDSASGEALSGVEFALYDAKGNEVARGVTGEDGTLTFEDVLYGQYTLRELTGKEGYLLNDTPVNVEIRENGVTVELEITNEKIPEIPKTGDNAPILSLAVLAAGSGALLLVVKRRRRKR